MFLLLSAVPLLTAGAGSQAGSRAGTYEFLGPINVTQNTVSCSSPDMAFDSNDNILMVYVCDNYNITYTVMGPDHTTILAPTMLSNSSDGNYADPRIVVTTNGTVQIVYSDETDSSPTFQFHDRLVLDLMATHVTNLIGQGDEDIQADHDGNVFGYDFFSRPGGGPQPPEPGGPLP